MDSYTPLLEKTRIPQPSLQKLAVVSIFEKFRSSPPSDAGRDAITRCLRSASAAIVDQSTRELCRLVKDAKLDVATGLLELQSALEESSNPQFTSVFIKAIGLLTRLGFEENPSSFRFYSSENHPFVKVVLRQLAGIGLLVHEAQLCGLELLDAILSQHRDLSKYSGGVEKVLDAARHLLAIQKELGLEYCIGLRSVMLSLFSILTQTELEHEQYSILKLVLFLLRWRGEKGYKSSASTIELTEELLFIFPLLALVSSPSRSIKQSAIDLLSVLGKTAADLLTAPTEKEVVEGEHLTISTPGHLVFRFLRNMWLEDQLPSDGFLYVNHLCDGGVCSYQAHSKLKTWISSIREYSLVITGKYKSATTITRSEEFFLREMPLVLCSIAGVFLLHQETNFAVDLFAIGSDIGPKLGVPLLLTILFYNHICSSAEKYNDFHDMLLKLLGLLPSVATHSAMIPLVLQILLPMLHKDANPVIKATAIRLICKTWEINDRVFASLQGMLHPNEIVQYEAERGIAPSLAVSIQDVCKRNPDRGVDIILSVAACIENHDPLVQSLGLQSLAHLCEADVIDFYTAWDVIQKDVQNYLGNAIVAYGLSHFLRWGAMDAEAYPEAATSVLNILWDIGTHREITGTLWSRARDAAFRALSQYEVVHIQRSIRDFGRRNIEFLISQANPDLLTAVEEFEVKIINYEHITRRRFIKQKRVLGSGSKIVKLLNVVPEAIFGSGSKRTIKELPGAALLCSHTRKDMRNQGSLKDVHTKFEDAALEISGSLLLERNILLALLSLQSWKPFMQRWLRSSITALDAKAHSTVLDNTSKAASGILKILTRLAEATIPRSAENIALALGAFCLVLPASAHAVHTMASEFLLSWLSQYEHEYRQWSAAISLGLISSCLHVTDHEQKFKNITTLLEAASISRSTLVKGASGIGLVFSCQTLLIRVDSGSNTSLERETYRMQETELLRKTIRTLVQMIHRFGGSSAGILEKLEVYFPLGIDYSSSPGVEFLSEDTDLLEEDAWGAAGPIIGLGNSLGAIYRAGARDAVLYLKSLIISWIPSANNLSPKSNMFSLGACLALPTVMSFCHRLELSDDTELDGLVSSFIELISALLPVEQSATFHQNLLMVSYVGAGSLLSIVLNSRPHSLEVEQFKCLLELCRRTFSSPHPPFVHLGAMLGVVNAMGAGSGMLIQHSSSSTFEQKEPSRVLDTLLSNHVLEAELTSMIQEMFLAAQNSDDPQSQQAAAWAVSFLRDFVFSREHANEESAGHSESSVSRVVSQGFSEDTVVMKLSMWLMQTNYSEQASSVNIKTVAFAVRCLSHAPRLPSLEWGTMIRQCMKYSHQVDETPCLNIAQRRGTLREECFLFLLSHANESDPLLGFLDELTDIARLKTLEPNLQSLVLLHLADLLKTFSSSRIVKLFDDVADFLHWFASSHKYNYEPQISMRVSCWKGLQTCLSESAALETQDYAYSLERCMEVLFTMLPWSHLSVTLESSYQKNSNVEWAEALRCLGKARQGWLSDFLLIPDTNFQMEHNQILKTLKKVKAKAALVRNGSIPLVELAKLKAYMMDADSEVIWSILVEVAVTLQKYDESVRRQWLADTAEILCVTSYPSTALRFLGLLSGISCKYMPILIANKRTVLSDLPFTLSSLLAGPRWEIVAESVASCLLKATQRIHDWATNVEGGAYLLGPQAINKAENEVAVFLLQVMHQTCVSLKEHLPVDKQLTLANMVIP